MSFAQQSPSSLPPWFLSKVSVQFKVIPFSWQIPGLVLLVDSQYSIQSVIVYLCVCGGDISVFANNDNSDLRLMMWIFEDYGKSAGSFVRYFVSLGSWFWWKFIFKLYAILMSQNTNRKIGFLAEGECF